LIFEENIYRTTPTSSFIINDTSMIAVNSQFMPLQSLQHAVPPLAAVMELRVQAELV
jgi:hypothetical protein